MMRSKHSGKVLGIALLMWGLCVSAPQAQAPSGISSVPALLQELSFASSDNQTRITVRANQTFDYTSYYPNPRLFILDIPGAESHLERNFVDFKTEQVDFAGISQIGEGPRPLLRIEFNLAQAIQYSLKPEGSKLYLTFKSMNPAVPEAIPASPKAPVTAKLAGTVASGPFPAKDVSFHEDEQQIELMLPTTGRPSLNHFELKGPNRLVIDVDDSVYKVSRQAVRLNSDLIRRIRFGFGDSPDGRLVRCVFDLSRTADYTVEAADSGVIIRFQKQRAVAATPDVKKTAEPETKVATAESTDPQPPNVQLPSPVTSVPESPEVRSVSNLLPAQHASMLLTDAHQFVMPAPLAAPRNMALLQRDITVAQIQPRDARPDLALVSGDLNMLRPLPPVTLKTIADPELKRAESVPAPDNVTTLFSGLIPLETEAQASTETTDSSTSQEVQSGQVRAKGVEPAAFQVAAVLPQTTPSVAAPPRVSGAAPAPGASPAASSAPSTLPAAVTSPEPVSAPSSVKAQPVSSEPPAAPAAVTTLKPVSASPAAKEQAIAPAMVTSPRAPAVQAAVTTAKPVSASPLVKAQALAPAAAASPEPLAVSAALATPKPDSAPALVQAQTATPAPVAAPESPAVSAAPKPISAPSSVNAQPAQASPDSPAPALIIRPPAAPAAAEPAVPVPPATSPAPLTSPAVKAAAAQDATSQIIAAAPVVQAQRYTGELISLELKDADIKDFFRLIGEISGLNIVLDPDVKGALTIFLSDVPWDQALDVVLKNNALGKQLDGNVLRIASNRTLEDEEAQRKRLSDARVLAAELQTETRILSYAKAAELSTVLKKVLSPRGDIIVDTRTNAMIISDIPGKFPAIDALIKQLDKKIKQVEIEARVIAATRDFLRDVGVQFGAIYGNFDKNTVAGALPGNPFSRSPRPSVTIDPGQSGGAQNALPLITNLGAQAPTSGLSFFAGITDRFLLDTIITAAERRGSAKLLSKPKIITQDNIEGFVQQGVKIPVQTTINNTVSVQFFDFSLKLTVTPQITDEGTIILKVDVENSTPDFSRQVQNVPTVNTQQTKTTVLVNNGGTVVVGGVLIDNEQTNVRQVPGIGSIPVIGNLFKNRSVNKQTQELIFFISPKII